MEKEPKLETVQQAVRSFVVSLPPPDEIYRQFENYISDEKPENLPNILKFYVAKKGNEE